MPSAARIGFAPLPTPGLRRKPDNVAAGMGTPARRSGPCCRPGEVHNFAQVLRHDGSPRAGSRRWRTWNRPIRSRLRRRAGPARPFLRGRSVFRTNRMIAAVTLALWASGAAAQVQPAGGDGASGQAQPQAPAACRLRTPQPPRPPPPTHRPRARRPRARRPPTRRRASATPAPQAQQQGTPATVLDTQDYESLLGRSVRSAGGDELGRVIDIIIDKDGHPRAAIIDFGGFLGVGTRKIAVDWRALRFSAEGGKERKLSVALTPQPSPRLAGVQGRRADRRARSRESGRPRLRGRTGRDAGRRASCRPPPSRHRTRRLLRTAGRPRRCVARRHGPGRDTAGESAG